MNELPSSEEGPELPRLEGDLKTLGPVVVRPVRDKEEDELWTRLVRLHHYLGIGTLHGRHLKYFAFVGHEPVAVLSFSAAALSLGPRDEWIGWSPEEKSIHLNRVVNNSRFLILPGIKVKNLSSCVLAAALSRLGMDWESRFGIRPWMVESFVDPERYLGTSYKAAGFLALGQTAGYAKTRTGYAHHGKPKEIFLFVQGPVFRSHVGLMRRDAKGPEVTVNVSHWKPSPAVLPDLPPSDPALADLTPQDIEGLIESLVQLHNGYQNILGDARLSRLGQAYLAGLCSNIERKSVEPIALALLEAPGRVRSLQQFISSYDWDEAAMFARYRSQVAETLVAGADPARSMLTLDSSEQVKSGKESAGVARQYCGRLGKVENCQSGVFVGYVSGKGQRLLDAQLYLPKKWIEDDDYAERREKTGIPKDQVFKTKPQIAGEMIRDLDRSGLFPAAWIGCDATFGMDRKFLAELPEGRSYLASVRSNLHVLTSAPQWKVPKRHASRGKAPSKLRLTETPMTVSGLAKTFSFTPMILKEGAKGPIGALLHACRVWRVPEFPEDNVRPEWLIVLKTPEGEMRFALSNAPEATTLEQFGHAATLRWSIERSFEECKSHLGMGDYEHRSFRGWRRHMFYVFLAHHFLQGVQLTLKKKRPSPSPWPKDSSAPSSPPVSLPRKRFSFFMRIQSKERPSTTGLIGKER